MIILWNVVSHELGKNCWEFFVSCIKVEFCFSTFFTSEFEVKIQIFCVDIFLTLVLHPGNPKTSWNNRICLFYQSVKNSLNWKKLLRIFSVVKVEFCFPTLFTWGSAGFEVKIGIFRVDIFLMGSYFAKNLESIKNCWGHEPTWNFVECLLVYIYKYYTLRCWACVHIVRPCEIHRAHRFEFYPESLALNARATLGNDLQGMVRNIAYETYTRLLVAGFHDENLFPFYERREKEEEKKWREGGGIVKEKKERQDDSHWWVSRDSFFETSGE